MACSNCLIQTLYNPVPYTILMLFVKINKIFIMESQS
jgi:hypothetical protein